MRNAKLIIGSFAATLFISLNFVSCKKENLPAQEDNSLTEPNLSVSFDYRSKHGVDNNVATLGRVLFYDKKLSVNNTTSCGSCHKQEFAFADNVRVNRGANGLNLIRNSPSIQGIKGFLTSVSNKNGDGKPTANNQMSQLLFWDGRQNSVSDMVLNPVLNHNEMNMPDLNTLVAKLSNTTYYPDLFTKAFGTETITKENIALALEGFLACLNTTTAEVVTDNPSNQYGSSQQDNPTKITLPPNGDTTSFVLNDLEKAGKFLFHNKYNCAKCHDPLLMNSRAHMFNIGLDEIYADNGLGRITGKPGDKGLFKVPTLMNIAVTAPYMHDGRFTDLSQVIDHYSHQIKPNANLSSQFTNFDGTPKKLNISTAEKTALIAFLKTLRDDDFLTSPMYSDPFKK